MVVTDKFLINWQKIVITEKEPDLLSISITMPRVTIYNNYELQNKISETITWYTNLLKDDFIDAASTIADENGDINTLDIDVDLLLATPRILSLAFIETKYLAGIRDDNPERTYLVFDLEKGELILNDVKLFRDDLAWFDAVEVIKRSLFPDYQEEPNCDLLFAPKKGGFAASCIGVDFDQGGKNISVTGDIPLSAVQKFISPEILNDIK